MGAVVICSFRTVWLRCWKECVVGYEIDFLPVGESSRSGDAICGRLFLPGRSAPVIFVVDGGYKSSGGPELVNHILAWYGPRSVVDLVVATHSDEDHINGLLVLLDEVPVRELWIHLPWQHAAAMYDLAVSARTRKATGQSIADKFERSLAAAAELVELAEKKNITVREPFAGLSAFDGALTVVGPTCDYYEGLLAEFRCAPVSAAAMVKRLMAAAASEPTLPEGWDTETLSDNGETSAENNSTALLHLAIDGARMLFTGDAGIPALERAADYMDATGLSVGSFRLVQVPHHGSHCNVGPTILDRLLGPRQRPGVTVGEAIASAAGEDEDHPARSVLNAFTRRGFATVTTEGKSVCFHDGSVNRTGWVPLSPVPLFYEVEDPGSAA
jgi:beta-lactamase superfamily II metal-dependent hydrolase